jgi:hypothetical protein
MKTLSCLSAARDGASEDLTLKKSLHNLLLSFASGERAVAA